VGSILGERMLAEKQHFEQLSRWLSMESEAEKAQFDHRRRLGTRADAEKSGETLLGLVITDHEAGLAGEILLTLVKRNRTLSMPWNRLRSGSPVVLSSEHDGGKSWHGVVTARGKPPHFERSSRPAGGLDICGKCCWESGSQDSRNHRKSASPRT